MVTTPRIQNYTLGRGEVHLAKYKVVNGLPTQIIDGFRYVGNTPAFSFTATSQDLDHISSDHGVGEQDFSITTGITRAGTLTTDDINQDNLAVAFLGSKKIITQASATATSETFVDVIWGLSYQLGMTPTNPIGIRNVANVVVKVGAVTKVAGTDYVVDVNRGLVRVVEGGTIISGTDDIIVTYDTTASSVNQVVSGATPFEGALLFLADNPAGVQTDYLMRRVRLTPNGEFAIKADNALQSLSFSLKILKAGGYEAIYANGQPYTA